MNVRVVKRGTERGLRVMDAGVSTARKLTSSFMAYPDVQQVRHAEHVLACGPSVGEREGEVLVEPDLWGQRRVVLRVERAVVEHGPEAPFGGVGTHVVAGCDGDDDGDLLHHALCVLYMQFLSIETRRGE